MVSRDSLFEGPEVEAVVTAGSRVLISGCEWQVKAVEAIPMGPRLLRTVGLTGIVKNRESIFIEALEKGNLRVLSPTEVEFLPDLSSNFEDAVLHVEAAMRRSAPVGPIPQVKGKAAIDDLAFQIEPTRKALAAQRVRLLIADDVGLGKTLEAGLIAAELILRRRAQRILVVTTKQMLDQFQAEFWNRFSIPLVKLDSTAIARVRNQLPLDHNPFDHFEKAIISIDTLKDEQQYERYLESTTWDLIIIDEAHNVAERRRGGARAKRAKLAERLSWASDAMLLLTATPHDGSFVSFGSLIRMLDPTALPDLQNYTREDVDRYLVRRFRDDPLVAQAMAANTAKRKVEGIEFASSEAEEEAYRLLASLKLDVDEGRRGGDQLFRTTLQKALFSSPAALIETIDNRIQRRSDRISANDLDQLTKIRDAAAAITKADFTAYRALLNEFARVGWKGKDPTDRIVVFSERIATLEWLDGALKEDLGLPDGAIRTLYGSGTDDKEQRKIVKDFGLERSKVRLLLASDIASEGLNLHFQSHRLYHFDLPWALLVFQQRNGRIDRYGQMLQPLIGYMLRRSANEEIRGDLRTLEVLVEKDQAAQKGIGDPAAFMGAVDAEDQEAVVATAIQARIGAEAFAKQLEENAASVIPKPASALERLLRHRRSTQEQAVTPADETASVIRLLPDTFTFVRRAIQRMSEVGDNLRMKVDEADGLIEIDIPDEFRRPGDLGVGSRSRIDTRYMPEEAVPPKGRIRLTTDRKAIDDAIRRALAESETGWPDMQYLWDVHPIVDWLADRVGTRLGRRAVPVCGLSGSLPEGRVVYLMHGAVSNMRGAPIVDRWQAVHVSDGEIVDREEASAFLKRIGFGTRLPNFQTGDVSLAARNAAAAVRWFQDLIIRLRQAEQTRLDDENVTTMTNLEALRVRHHEQLELKFAQGIQSMQERRKARERTRIDKAFTSWWRWVEESCTLPRDPNPHATIVAAFHG